MEPKLEDLQVMADGLETAYATAQRVAVASQSQGRGIQVQTEMPFADVALTDDSGYPDVFDTRVRITHNGEVLEDSDFSQWSEKIAEETPGSPAPRPYIIMLGKKVGRYRVGSVVQLLVGKVSMPRAAGLQAQWLSAPPDAALARAIVSLHVLELSGEIVLQLMKMSENHHLDEQALITKQWQAGISIGLVGRPRGILTHTHEVNAEGIITRAVILTPIAQNEPWLAALLTVATTGNINETRREAALEQSIREVGPYLPISSIPLGQMGLKLDIVSES